MTADEGIVRKIRKLLDKTVDRGCMPAEAADAAAKVQELLHKYQLSMFDVQQETYGETVAEESVDMPRGGVVFSWTFRLAGAVSRPLGCDYFVRRRFDPHKGRAAEVRFIGHKSDAAVSHYLFVTLSRVLLARADAEGRRYGRRGADLTRFKRSFMEGAAYEVHNRLEAERKRHTAEPTTTALVVVKNRAVQEYMGRQYPDIKTRRTTTRETDHDGVRAGIEAGRDVELTRGIEGGEVRRALC